MNDYFVDWVTVNQSHEGVDLPLVHDGFFLSLDKDGNAIFKTSKSFKLEGSYDTKLMVSCDGATVKMSGNFGAFGRLDNVFGYDLDTCMSIANDLLATLGLPPFTRGECFLVDYASTGHTLVYTGASFSRLDVTTNLSLGSDGDAKAFLNFLSGQKLYRTKQQSYGPGETVYTVASGQGSKHLSVKLYLKSEEIKHHKNSFLFSRIAGQLKLKKTEEAVYLSSLVDYLTVAGFVRFECSLRSNFLRKTGLAFWGNCSMEKLTVVANERLEPVLSSTVSVDNISDLPYQAQAVYHAWLAGVDIRSMYKQRQFYTYRKLLKTVGVDIAFAPSVHIEPLKIREVSVSPAVVPDFYQLPFREAA